MIVALDLFSLNPPVTDRAHTHTHTQIQLAFYLKAKEYLICISEKDMNCFNRNENAEIMQKVVNMKILQPQ